MSFFQRIEKCAVEIFLSVEQIREVQQYNGQDFLQKQRQSSILYQESEKWHKIFFDFFHNFCEKSVSAYFGGFFKEQKSVQGSGCFL
jgi:hypothetical protein